MKHALLMMLALAICAREAAANLIAIRTNETGTYCSLKALVPFPATNTLYIVHQFNFDGATASQFKVNNTSGLVARVADHYVSLDRHMERRPVARVWRLPQR